MEIVNMHTTGYMTNFQHKFTHLHDKVTSIIQVILDNADAESSGSPGGPTSPFFVAYILPNYNVYYVCVHS